MLIELCKVVYDKVSQFFVGSGKSSDANPTNSDMSMLAKNAIFETGALEILDQYRRANQVERQIIKKVWRPSHVNTSPQLTKASPTEIASESAVSFRECATDRPSRRNFFSDSINRLDLPSRRCGHLPPQSSPKSIA